MFVIVVQGNENDSAFWHRLPEFLDIGYDSYTRIGWDAVGLVFQAFLASKGDIVCCVFDVNDIEGVVIEGLDVLCRVSQIIEFAELVGDAQDLLFCLEDRTQ